MNRKKTAFTTGAGKGLGREMAVLFAARGWTVAATDTSEADLASLGGLLGKGHFLRAMDVTDGEQVAAVLAAFARQHGKRLDLLINNAGLADIGDFDSIPLARHH